MDPIIGESVEKPNKMGDFPYKEVEFEERNRQVLIIFYASLKSNKVCDFTHF
jgi:hypothetical protein